MGNKIKKVGIIGAGFTGKQIAAQAALHDFIVIVYDINPKIVEDAKKYITGVLTRKNQLDTSKNVIYYQDLREALEDVDLVIEAVPEDLELKKKIFSQIDDFAPAHTIIGTNSSSYPVSKIESAVKRKNQVLNLHFYPPIPTRPMVDIMRGTATSDETFEIGKNWIKNMGCEPIVVKKECLGFVFNRIWHTARKEALNMWDRGNADIETIDLAWKIFTGMNMGPFVLMDGIGLDTVYAVQMSYFKESGDPRDKPPDALKQMVKNGDLGMKTGKGFYTWKKKK
ncbi:MAG: 3-hydroxyacyl-CoA dehydrogenase family protein [Candidatus Lokiarchaeota archaeon]|nr:3-hydroxyacyl-CoA dehydrogenase family protein [Candidatus Lokiarchaeota archaeon]